MTVVYAEKPDLARKIASALNPKGKSQNGYIELEYKGEPTIVTWGFGHMYTLQNAYDYDPMYKKWDTSIYPFFPDNYKIAVRAKVNEQLKIVGKLLRNADVIVNATDAGREGELIFSYVMEGLRIPKKPVKRLWLHSVEPEDVKRSYDNMRDGKQMHSLEQAARARSIIDWSIGINLTIFATKAFQCTGQTSQPISIGRVQTPTLALIVNRELEIKNFISTPYWNIDAEFKSKNGIYTARLDGDSFQAEKDALNVLSAINGKNGTVEDVSVKREDIAPPELHNLSSLQKEASKRFKFTAQQTLDIAQELYEKELLSYPRSNSKHLPENMKSTVTNTLNSLSKHPMFKDYLDGIKYEPFTKRHFDDKKVGEHFAIIPTGKLPPDTLSEPAKKIYQLVALSLIRVAYPYASFEKTNVVTDVADYKFKSTGKRLLNLGWMAVDAEPKNDTLLPHLTVGENVSGDFSVTEGKTTPPSRFTDGSLVDIMEHISKIVDDKEIKERLKGIGIGTEATRAKIIEQLVLREYIRRDKNLLVPTELGMYVIQNLPVDEIKSPVLTGELELMLSNIESGTETLDATILASNTLVTQWCDKLRPLCEASSTVPRPAMNSSSSSLPPCPLCGRPLVERSDFIGCSGYSDKEKPCKLYIKKVFCGKKLTASQLNKLLLGDSISVKGLKSNKGKSFDATFFIDHDGRIKFLD